MRHFLPLLLTTTCLVSAGTIGTLANPLDGAVVAGDAAIAGQGTANVTVNQTTDKAIIDWRSFNIAPNETTQFNQPSANSVVLNRVTGGEGMSTIAGSLKANGNVFLINPDGILFGKDSIVDVGGFVATTHDINNSDFLAGRYNFNQPGNPSASIVNLGTINVEDNGFAALVAPGVRNAGVIRARLGTVALGSANGFSLDFYGDDLLTLAVDSETAGTIIDVATGQPITALVDNSGLISADGGTIQLTASAARAVVDAVVNTSGTLEANSVGMRNGKIVLGASTKPSSNARPQKLKVSGKVSTAGNDTGETGGHIELTAEIIELFNATIDAAGYVGGGTVLIGGDYMGGNGDPSVIAENEIPLEDHKVATAAVVMLDENTSISADALENGDGGKVIVWSDYGTFTSAEISARGGAISGDGGFIETSGKYLDVSKAADASAVNGEAGTWLLDPLDVRIKNVASQNTDITYATTIYPGVTGNSEAPNNVGPSIISTSSIESALNAGTNIRVITRGTLGGEPGDVYVDDDVTKSAGGDVFVNINAANNVYFASGVDLVSTSGRVAFHVYAADGQIFGNNVGTIDVNGGQLLFEARNGVDFHSTGNMPDLFTLSLNSSGAPTIPLVNVDISFDQDIIQFSYVDGLATVPTNGVQLIDSSPSTFDVQPHGMDVILKNKSVRVGPNKGWSVTRDAGYNFGRAATDGIDGIPEVILNQFASITKASGPMNLILVDPFLEVNFSGGETTQQIVPTSNRTDQKTLQESLPEEASQPFNLDNIEWDPNAGMCLIGATSCVAPEPNSSSIGPFGSELNFEPSIFGGVLPISGQAALSQRPQEGNHGDYFSNAFDFAAPMNTSVLGIGQGTVLDFNDTIPDFDGVNVSYDVSRGTQNTGGLGNYITIAYSDGNGGVIYATYAHLKQGSISGLGLIVGSSVNAGQELGKVGRTGGTIPARTSTQTSDHLHVHFGSSKGGKVLSYSSERDIIVAQSRDGEIVVEYDSNSGGLERVSN